ncbi:MAG TPA: outer membrane beta-barrel protein [Rhizomicrobium sp.]|nr:outer membrane beta-barrel protein [Rhizomicrobium sp.]
MKGGASILATVVLALSATHCIAEAVQGVPDPNIPPIRAQADIVYNSNVTASSRALATQNGLALADQIYTPSLDVNFVRQLGLDSFSLVGQGGYDFYQRNTILNRERLNAQSAFAAQLDGCQVTLQGSFSRAQSTIQNLTIATVNDTVEDISGGLKGVCNQTGRLVPSVSVTQDWTTNSALQLLTSDARSTATQGSIMYRNSPLGDISLLGQYTEAQFPHRLLPTALGLREDGYKLYSGGLQLEHHFGSDVDFSISVSEDSLKSNSRIGPKFNGITYDSSLVYRIDTRLQARLGFSRKTNPSNLLNASYSIAQAYSAEADYHLTSRLLSTLGASQTRSDLNGFALVPGVDLTRESVKSFFGTLRFDITPLLSVNLTANQDQRHADVIGYTYASTRFGLSISQAF